MVFPAYNKVFDTNSQVKPETQAVVTIRNENGSAASTPASGLYGGAALSGAITVTTTPQLVNVTARRSGSADIIQLENADDSAQPLYFGPKDTVSSTGATRGHELNPGDTASWSVGSNGSSIYVVTATGTATLVWSIL